MNLLSVLEGKKTYIIAILLGALSACRYLGYLDETTFQTLFSLLTGGGLAALRSGVKSA